MTGSRPRMSCRCKGIDISKWQGDINWGTVKSSGVAFAFIKATEGKDIVDQRFLEYSQEARPAAGIPSALLSFLLFLLVAPTSRP